MEQYYEGSRQFMQGLRRVREKQLALNEEQRLILEALSDGQLHSIKELEQTLKLGRGKLMVELDNIGDYYPVYEESYGRRCSVAMLSEESYG